MQQRIFALALALGACTPVIERVDLDGGAAPHPSAPGAAGPGAPAPTGPGAAPSGAAAPALPVPTSAATLQLGEAVPVVLSEIMYHPVGETTDHERHEFVELYNRSGKAVDLSGWTLESDRGALKFTFPAGAAIAAGQHRVVAKDRKALAALPKYALAEGDLLGDYAGELDNGGFTLILRDRAGKPIDAVKVNDRFPWPLAADELGVGDDWLPADQLPIDKHRYMGRSLERISTDAVSSTPANWEASALDGATPGKPNGAAGQVLPVAEVATALADGTGTEIIRSTQKISFRVRFSAFAPVTAVELEYFVDDVAVATETPMKAPMNASMSAGDDGVHTVALGPFKDNSLVRWRVRATRGGRQGVVAPRPTDPLAWYTAFVSPVVFVKPGQETKERTYHLFITPQDWTNLERWIAAGRASGNGGCNVNPDWQRTAPATLVLDGHAYDVRVRYTGSRDQRMNGLRIASFPAPAPNTGSTGLRALSWAIKFPKYDRPGGRRRLTLNKQFQGCPGTVSYVESKLLERAGMPTYLERFARLHINGAYYHYMAEPEDIDAQLLERVWPNEPVGDLFKNDGAGGDNGPIGRGDFRPIGTNGSCPQYTKEQRYRATFRRRTHEHRPYDEIIALVTDLAAAKNMGPQAVRDYFTKYWDVDLLAAAFAVRNWSGVWDDTWHNVHPYKRSTNGKWYLIQQDFEGDLGLGKLSITGIGPLGTWNPAQTLYIGWNSPDQAISKGCELPPGMQGGCNGLGFSALKDAFIGAFRKELDDKYRELARKGVLSAAGVLAVIDEAASKFSLDDWNHSPASKPCEPAKAHDMMRAWARDRAAAVTQKLGP